MRDDSVPIFTEDYLDFLHARFTDRDPNAKVSKDQLRSALTLSLDATVSQLDMFWPTGSTTTLVCDMPHNKHTYSGSGKHCAACNLSYCTRHAITHCVKCGALL